MAWYIVPRYSGYNLNLVRYQRNLEVEVQVSVYFNYIASGCVTITAVSCILLLFLVLAGVVRRVCAR